MKNDSCPGRGAALISAFTRVFDALWWFTAEPGPNFSVRWTPGLQRTARALRCARGTQIYFGYLNSGAAFSASLVVFIEASHLLSFWS